MLFIFAVLPRSSLRAQTASDINEGLRVTASTSTSGAFTMSWFGKTGRSYFIQTSETLMSGDWQYVPIVESGTGQIIEWAFTSTAPRFFLRLQYTDVTYTGTATAADFDGDKMPNGWEVANGLNPLLDDAFDDADGDRAPNLYEFANNTDPTNAASQPVPYAIVDPANAAASTTDNIYATIQAALNSVPMISTQPTMYYVVTVKSGVYPETVAISRKRVLLMSSEPGGNPVIAPTSSGSALAINFDSDETIVRDLTVSGEARAENVYGPGVYIDLNSGSMRVRLTNCIISNHNYGANVGAGILLQVGRLTMTHCTVYNNETTGLGRSLYIVSTGSDRARITNCILWSKGSVVGEEIQAVGSASVTGSLIKVTGAVDPYLDHQGFLTSASVSPRGLGVSSNVAKVDLQGETRSSPVDAGADQYIDSDNDSLPDWWEMNKIGNMASTGSGHLDGDTLTNAQENIFGTDPLVADSDADGAVDSAEYTAQTNPRMVDTDGDSMLDGYEISYQLEPLNYRDTLADKDGDRVPNVYEHARGTLPNDANSRPTYDVLVDSSLAISSNVKPTIATALTRLTDLGQDFGIIQVNRGSTGVYPEQVVLSNRKVLLLGEAGSTIPVIGGIGGENSTLKLLLSNCVVDGFVITHPASGAFGAGVSVDIPGYRGQARVVNSLITGNQKSDTPGIFMLRGELTLAHCTVFGNQRTGLGTSPTLGIKVEGIASQPSTLLLQNTICWNDDGYTGGAEIRITNYVTVGVTNSIVRGGAFGGLNLNPQLDSFGRLMAFSPAINPSPPVLLSTASKDIYNEPRDSMPDIGADEFYDSDNDMQPDHWELSTFSSLSHAGNVDEDADGLSNFGEYMAGLNPMVADSDGDGVGDLAQAVGVAATAYYYVGALSVDADGDGLTLAQEQLLGSDPNQADSNGDGLPDGVAWSMGLSLTNSDPDGDGVATSLELAQGTSPITADTDGDGVVDLLDAFPLDPNATSLTSGDVIAPVVALTKPADATLIP
ncbi:MAG: hypothetical protein ABL974_00260 [Prosthecobacter sp.]